MSPSEQYGRPSLNDAYVSGCAFATYSDQGRHNAVVERYRLINVTRGTVVATAVQRAHTWRRRARGLLGTSSLAETAGLLLEPCRQVHMRGMTYPLYVVYCDRHGRALACLILLPGQRGPFLWRAAAVIELSPAVATQVAVGDVLVWHAEAQTSDDTKCCPKGMEASATPASRHLRSGWLPRLLAATRLQEHRVDVWLSSDGDTP